MSTVPVPSKVRSRYYGPQVRAAANRLIANLESRRPGVVERLRDDPVVEMQTWDDELAVQIVPQYRLRGSCSVLGQYADSTEPPTLSLVASGSHGQRRFTALHELGHHEQAGDAPWFDEALSQQSDLGQRLEEQVCDSFAAEVLLGQDVVDRVLGDVDPTAESVVALRDASGASGAACCVRVAQLLRCEGFVLATDLAGELFFVAVNGSTWYRPKRGTRQGDDSLAVRAASLGLARDEDSFIQYGTGSRVVHLRGDAVRSGSVVYVVLRDGRAPWQTTDLGPHAAWEVPDRNCHACGEVLEYPGDAPCPECRRPRCPACGAACASCKPTADRICKKCKYTWARARFPADGEVCADCV